MKKIIPSFLLGVCLFMTNVSQAQIQFSFGGGALVFTPQNFSYLSTPELRPTYEVVPPKQRMVFFPVSVNLRYELIKWEPQTMSLGLSLPISMAAFFSTDPNAKEFVTMQLPLLLNLNWGARAFPTAEHKSDLGAYLGLGMMYQRFSVPGIKHDANFLPVAEIGGRIQAGRVTFELAYNRSFIFDDYDFGEFFLFRGDDHFRLGELDLYSQAFVVRIYIKQKSNDTHE